MRKHLSSSSCLENWLGVYIACVALLIALGPVPGACTKFGVAARVLWGISKNPPSGPISDDRARSHASGVSVGWMMHQISLIGILHSDRAPETEGVE
ncbi:hypothetical protein DFH27DRAFT_558650 [Peziza echinospora]|nr:hypothetical protein DFH27DRAFT_558650 [Peziza echinospora]